MRRLIIVAFFALLAAPALAEKATQPVCEITGTVIEIVSIERLSTTDGAPSMLTTLERRISILPESRTARGAEKCPPVGKDAISYKICAPTPVKPGDRIRGTEAGETGSPYAQGCLFDIVTLQKK